MPPPPPSSPVPAPDAFPDWQRLGAQWLHWWAQARRPGDAAAPAPAAEPSAPPIPPDALAELTRDYQAGLAALWQAVAHAPATPPAVVPVPEGDRRFAAPEWRESPFHAFVLQAWLLHARYLTALAAKATLPPAAARRLAFMTRQYLDALAPSNHPATNPDVVKRALATEGASLVRGVRNLLEDMRRGRISMTDAAAFAVGRNLAITPGQVVYRNALIELIQYAPSTPTVHARPLVIVPPCINKYYILDLTPANSFVRHAVAQGHTTFIVSWRNIPPELGRLGWDDYLERGVLAALRVARAVTGSRTVNALGFCVGGTLLASALAVLAARGDRSVTSATLLTTMLDFADPGEIGVYVSPEFLATREAALLAGARLQGSELAGAFASLRANDLVWNYVVGNYLKGETPPAFDLLAWNGDSANLPGPMYVYYLRELYLANRLREPDALTMAGARIDLRRVTVPTYVFAARDDHIVPWRSAYRTRALLGGPTTFVLGASGHIAGAINPPDPPRRNHWTNDADPGDADRWLEGACSAPGSWWVHWAGWLARHAGRRRAAPARLGSDAHPPLQAAPGTYVLESA